MLDVLAVAVGNVHALTITLPTVLSTCDSAALCSAGREAVTTAAARSMHLLAGNR